MAKRKSINRRLSRYSRCSTGSAVLDNDTEILGDEEAFWWKNLENNTIVRQSTESNFLNQTSPRLDTSSRLEISKVQDGWWKLLENSDICDASKIVAEKALTDAVRNLEVMTSESEEETRLQRRKLLPTTTRRTQDSNIFLKILNESKGSVASEPAQRSAKISLNSTSKSDVPPTQRTHNSNQDGSTDQSEIMILKPKPKIFGRRQARRSNNVFDDVLQNDVQSRMSTRDLRIVLEKTSVETETARQSRGCRLTLSFEDHEHDTSPFPVPKAQSTILEGAAQATVNDDSDTETVIVKPKSRFLKRYRKSDANAFEDVLADETIEVVQTEKDRSNTQDGNLEKLPMMSPTVRLTRMSILKDGRYVASNASIEKHKSMKSISASKLEEVLTKSTGDVPKENLEESREEEIQKFSSKYSRSPAKSPVKANAHRDTFEAATDTSARRVSARRTEEKENMNGGNGRILRKSQSLSKDVQESEIDSQDLALRLSPFSSEDKLETGEMPGSKRDEAVATKSASITGRSSGQRKSKSGILKNAKENLIADRSSTTRDLRKSKSMAEDEMLRSTSEKTEESRRSNVHTPKDRNFGSLGHSNLEKQSKRSSMRSKSEDEYFENNNDISETTLTEQLASSKKSLTGSLRRSTKDNDSRLTETKTQSRTSSAINQVDETQVTVRSARQSISQLIDDSGNETIDVPVRRYSKNTSRLQKQLTTILSDDSEEDEENVTGRRSKSPRKSERLLSSRVTNDVDREEIEDLANKHSEKTNKSRNQLREEHKKHSMSLSRSPKKSTSEDSNIFVREDRDDVTKSHTENISRSKKRSTMLVPDDSDAEVRNVRESRSKSLMSRSRQRPTSTAPNEISHEKVENIPTRHSENANKSNKRLTVSISNESERDEQDVRENRSRSLRGSRRQKSSHTFHEVEVEANEDVREMHSEKSRWQLTTLVSSDKEEEEEQHDIVRERSKSLRRSRKKSSSRVPQHLESETNDIVRNRHSVTAIESNKRSNTLISGESDVEEEKEDAQKKQSVSRRKKSSVAYAPNDLEIETNENLSKRRSESTNRSKRRLTTRSSDDSDKEEQKARVKRSKSVNRSRKASIQQAADHSENESESPARTPSENARASKSRVTSPIVEESDSENESVRRKESESGSKSKMHSMLSISNGSRKGIRLLSPGGRSSFEESFASPRSNRNNSIQRPIPPTFNGLSHEDDQRAHAKNQSNVVSKDIQNEREDRNRSRVSTIPSVSYETENEEESNLSKNLPKNLNDQRNEERPPLVQKSISRTHARSSVSKIQKNIDEFFRPRTTALVSESVPSSQLFSNSQKIESVKKDLEKVRERELAAMELESSNVRSAKSREVDSKRPGKNAKPFERQQPVRPIDKAYMVNGKVYKTPRLSRPKYWVTDRLYNFLWKRMEPKHGIVTRVRSEKFVQQLANLMTLIVKRKSYENYEDELNGLMMEMARLGLIRTRRDFYHFCHEYLPYEYRMKTVPMLLPGNKRNIPYDPETVDTLLLES